MILKFGGWKVSEDDSVGNVKVFKKMRWDDKARERRKGRGSREKNEKDRGSERENEKLKMTMGREEEEGE